MTDERLQQLRRYHGDGRLDRQEITELFEEVHRLRSLLLKVEYQMERIAEMAKQATAA